MISCMTVTFYVCIAANKIDLLPGDASSVRLTGWIHSEVKEICGLKSPRESTGEYIVGCCICVIVICYRHNSTPNFV